MDIYKISSSKDPEVFRSVPVNERGQILLQLNRRVREAILQKLKDEEVIELLHYPDPDEVADIIQSLKERRREKIINKLTGNRRGKVEFLLKFNPKTAAGMMSLDYIQINKGATFENVSKIIRKHEKRTGKFPTLLVVEKGFIKGELPGYVLALYEGKQKIDKYVRKIPSVKYDKTEAEVIRLFKNNPHNKVVVLDDDQSIIGIIYSDDVLRVIGRRPDKLSSFAGVSEEDVLDSALTKVRYRYKWLILNLFTAFLAASVVSLFQDSISALILLAVYMPVMAGMGGNTGIQALAVSVRGLALKEIELRTSRKVVINEVISGCINGVITGFLVALVAVFINQTPLLGLIAFVSMVITLVVASLSGSIIPLILKNVGKDPASSASIFITTVTDVAGFLVFLGLASMFLV